MPFDITARSWKIRSSINVMPNANLCCNQPALQVVFKSLTLLLTALVISACASDGNTRQGTRSQEPRSNQSILVQTDAPMGRVLVTVRLKGRFDLPQALAIDYSSEQGDSLESSVGMLQQGLSGHHGDYPILLKMSAGRYRLRSLRVAGLSLNAEGAMLTRLGKTFDAVASDTRYVGRLTISDNNSPSVQPSISWQNHYDEDTLLARSSGRALPDQKITNASADIQTLPVAPSTVAAATVNSSTVNTSKVSSSRVAASSEQQITIGKVGPTILYALSDQQKPLFQQFLRTAPPRAFAVGDFGAAGFASGNDAINLAMQRCGRRGNKESCRILAIDDAVVLAFTEANTNLLLQ